MFFAPTLDRRQPVVLITHGSMNPVHRGHVEMMVRARSAQEAHFPYPPPPSVLYVELGVGVQRVPVYSVLGGGCAAGLRIFL